jgi:hypothetical protein
MLCFFVFWFCLDDPRLKCFACLLGCVCAAAGCRLTRLTAGEYSGWSLAVVDLYDSSSGQWTTAQLSEARSLLAATSVGNVAIFAGGE